MTAGAKVNEPQARLQATAARGEPPAERKPLEWRLIYRLFSYTRPHATKRNWLVFLVVLRSLQLPALAWLTAATMSGPVAAGDAAGIVRGSAAFACLALATQGTMHFRQRLALELGEDVVHDLRRDLFARLHALPLGFFHHTPLGSIASRMTSDVELVRSGVQEVFFVVVVLAGQMTVAAGCMLWYDPALFGLVLIWAWGPQPKEGGVPVGC